MAQLIDPAATDAAADAYIASIFRLIELSPGMYSRTGAAGTRLTFTGLPVAILNLVHVGPAPDLDEVDAFAKELSATGVPWSIKLRGEASPELLEVAARYDRTSTSTSPLLVCDTGRLSSLPEPALPSDARVHILTGSESELYASALAKGFEMPKEIADVFTRPALLDSPDMTAFALEVGGEAVATGLNIITGDQMGMFNGSVLPECRRNGYYRALVIARLQHAVKAGARHAFTQNTPMSQPLYESLGFQIAATFTYLGSEG
jgi:hypothetical protein